MYVCNLLYVMLSVYGNLSSEAIILFCWRNGNEKLFPYINIRWAIVVQSENDKVSGIQYPSSCKTEDNMGNEAFGRDPK